MKLLNFKTVIFLITLTFGIVFSYPSLTQSETGKKISLGLDLQGGLHMLLGVKTQESIENKIKSIASSIKYYTDKENLLVEDIIIENNSFSFKLLDKSEKSKIDKMLSEMNGLDIKESEKNKSFIFEIKLTEEESIRTKKEAVASIVDTIRNRLDQFGLSEPTVSQQGKDKIIVQLPGIKTIEEEKKARELISKPAKLELMTVDEKLSYKKYNMTLKEIKDSGNILLEDKNNENNKYLLRKIPLLTGKQITDANVVFDKSNQPIISFKLNSIGGQIFGDFTGNNIGSHLAVVLDGKVYSSPVINERIGGGAGQISGGFTLDEASGLAIALRSGSLPASIELLEKRSVGPSLGADSIKSSLIALVSGFILVFLFMILYYGYAGIISNIALISNIFIIIAVMAMFGATLTLPGMAGIVLTVGMAVDSNVIINERIRELLKEGKTISKSIEEGYSNAMRAILDANITTLLVSIILYAYGTGPIKGFALTISIGILASMITAIIGTHGMYNSLLPRMNKNKNIKQWFGVK
jgi:preprotein translocase subunit SecD